MSKYNLTDILNEYVGGSRHGTINISYRDLQDAMDKIEADGDFVVRELSGPSGDGKVNREFEVVFIGAARGDNKQEEAGFTVYDYKFGFDPASENNFDEVLPFSIGGNNKEAALKIAKYLLGNRVQGYMANDKEILRNFDPKDINDVLFSFESNTDEDGEFKTSMGFNEDMPPKGTDKITKDLVKADEVIKMIKMMNPDVKTDLLMRIARMGQKLNEGDLFSSEFDRQELKAIINDLNKDLILDMPTRRAYKFLVSLLDNQDKEEMGLMQEEDVDEVMGIDRLGREKPETEPTDLSRAKMKLREDMRRFRNAVKDVSGISDEDKEELARTLARFSLTNFKQSDKGDVFFHDENTIQQLGKRSKAYADKIGISSNTPYYNSIEYYEKQQFSQVKDFIKNRLQVARLGLKAVMSGAYTDEEVAVYKPLLQDQVAMLMKLDDMDNNALEDLFRRNPSTDKEWQELFRRHPKGNLDKQFKFKTDTDIKSINSKKPNITADDEIDAELGNALANLDRDEDYERLMKAVEKLRDKGKDDEAFALQRRGDRMYGRGRDGRYYDEERIDEGFVKQMYTILSDYGSPMEINTYMDSLGNEFRLSPDSKDKYDDFSEDDWVEDFRVYVDDKSLQEHFRRFNIKKYS